jgi:hypothetical protein
MRRICKEMARNPGRSRRQTAGLVRWAGMGRAARSRGATALPRTAGAIGAIGSLGATALLLTLGALATAGCVAPGTRGTATFARPGGTAVERSTPSAPTVAGAEPRSAPLGDRPAIAGGSALANNGPAGVPGSDNHTPLHSAVAGETSHVPHQAAMLSEPTAPEAQRPPESGGRLVVVQGLPEAGGPRAADPHATSSASQISAGGGRPSGAPPSGMAAGIAPPAPADRGSVSVVGPQHAAGGGALPSSPTTLGSHGAVPVMPWGREPIVRRLPSLGTLGATGGATTSGGPHGTNDASPGSSSGTIPASAKDGASSNADATPAGGSDGRRWPQKPIPLYPQTPTP